MKDFSSFVGNVIPAVLAFAFSEEKDRQARRIIYAEPVSLLFFLFIFPKWDGQNAVWYSIMLSQLAAFLAVFLPV